MSDLETLQAEANQFKGDFQRILDEVHKVIVGQERVVDCTVTELIAGGNVLLEGVPGLGKTELVKTLGDAPAFDAVVITDGRAPQAAYDAVRAQSPQLMILCPAVLQVATERTIGNIDKTRAVG